MRARRTTMPVLAALLSVLALLVPTTSAAAPAAPAGFRYVGLGHVAIAVPKGWPNGFVQCGPTKRGVVVIDWVLSNVCQGVYPSVASVTISRISDVDVSTWTTEPDGRLREATTCHGKGDEHFCVGGVAVYDSDRDGTAFVVASPKGKPYVDRLLSHVASFRSKTAVPTWERPQAVTGPYASAYVALLTSSGFHVQTVVVGGRRAGSIVSVKPAVGTMLAPGATVTVTRTGPGPDEAPVGYHYIGIGRAVIAAPAAWPIVHRECADDAVVLDQDGPPDCLAPRAQDAGSISVLHFYPGQTFSHRHPGTVDGVRVYYTAIKTQTDEAGTREWYETAYVPKFRGIFDVESTTSPDQVRSLLAGLHVLRHRVAVPFVNPSPGQPEQTVGHMIKALRALGLHADLELAAGTNRGSPVSVISPAGGLIVDRGTTVTVRTRPPAR